MVKMDVGRTEHRGWQKYWWSSPPPLHFFNSNTGRRPYDAFKMINSLIKAVNFFKNKKRLQIISLPVIFLIVLQGNWIKTPKLVPPFLFIQ